MSLNELNTNAIWLVNFGTKSEGGDVQGVFSTKDEAIDFAERLVREKNPRHKNVERKSNVIDGTVEVLGSVFEWTFSCDYVTVDKHIVGYDYLKESN